MGHVVWVGLTVVTASLMACSGSDTSTAGVAAAAARDSAAKADSARAEETSKTLKITNIMIGKRIGPGGRVAEPTFQFDPVDTVYVSIGSVGSPDTAAFQARFTNQKGEAVDSSVKTIEPKGREHTELHAARVKGWAPGAYRITIYFDGDSVDSKTFAVRKPQ